MWPWLLTRGSSYSDLTWKLLVFWKSGSLWEVVAKGGLTVLWKKNALNIYRDLQEEEQVVNPYFFDTVPTSITGQLWQIVSTWKESKRLSTLLVMVSLPSSWPATLRGIKNVMN